MYWKQIPNKYVDKYIKFNILRYVYLKKYNSYKKFLKA